MPLAADFIRLGAPDGGLPITAGCGLLRSALAAYFKVKGAPPRAPSPPAAPPPPAAVAADPHLSEALRTLRRSSEVLEASFSDLESPRCLISPVPETEGPDEGPLPPSAPAGEQRERSDEGPLEGTEAPNEETLSPTSMSQEETVAPLTPDGGGPLDVDGEAVQMKTTPKRLLNASLEGP